MIILILSSYLFFFFNDTATTEIYTLSLHDALPIWQVIASMRRLPLHDGRGNRGKGQDIKQSVKFPVRSEEHTSELQSRLHLVCRLLLEKKKNKRYAYTSLLGK